MLRPLAQNLALFVLIYPIGILGLSTRMENNTWNGKTELKNLIRWSRIWDGQKELELGRSDGEEDSTN